jgi:hypothetical protein
VVFRLSSDSTDMPFALEASKDSEEDAESSSGNEESSINDGSFGAMDGDAMVK